MRRGERGIRFPNIKKFLQVSDGSTICLLNRLKKKPDAKGRARQAFLFNLKGRFNTHIIALSHNFKEKQMKGLELIDLPEQGVTLTLISTHESVNEAKPITVILTNNSGKAVVSLRMEAAIVGKDGAMTPILGGGIICHGLLEKVIVHDPRLKLSLMENGDSRQFTFDNHSISPDDNDNGGHFTIGSIVRTIDGVELEHPMVTLVKSCRSVRIMIAGIVFEDGGFYGTNDGYDFESISASMNAERDFTLKMREYVNSDDTTLAGLIAELERIDNAGRPEQHPSHFATAEQTYQSVYAVSLYHQASEFIRRRTAPQSLTDKHLVQHYASKPVETWIMPRRGA